jgi:hypothetical protein
MSTSTPAENLIQAMRNIVREMTAAGKFAEGIQRATVFIDSMAGQEKSNV